MRFILDFYYELSDFVWIMSKFYIKNSCHTLLVFEPVKKLQKVTLIFHWAIEVNKISFLVNCILCWSLILIHLLNLPQE